MKRVRTLFCCLGLLLAVTALHAGSCNGKTPGTCKPPACDKEKCCSLMGGISYCDSSAGRLVCNNGFYSSCYCTRHAVMDLQLFEGCCLWQGGVSRQDEVGVVICQDGTVSESCTLENAAGRTSGIW